MEKFNFNSAILNKVFEELSQIIHDLEYSMDQREDADVWKVLDVDHPFSDISKILRDKFDFERQELEEELQNINDLESYSYNRDSDFPYLPNEFSKQTYIDVNEEKEELNHRLQETIYRDENFDNEVDKICQELDKEIRSLFSDEILEINKKLNEIVLVIEGLITSMKNFKTKEINHELLLEKIIEKEDYSNLFKSVNFSNENSQSKNKETTDGLITNYHDNGQVESIISYEFGKINGLAKYFFENGNTKKKEEYVSGIKNGPFEAFHKDGSLIQKGWYKEGKRSGKWIDYYLNGDVFIEKNYSDGKKTGVYEVYYENKNLKGRWEYKDNKMEGLFQSFYDDGQIEREINKTNGKNDGLFTEYYPDGTVMLRGSYVKGKKNGLWKQFYMNGKTQEEGMFLNGKKIGLWNYFNYDGSLKEHETYN